MGGHQVCAMVVMAPWPHVTSATVLDLRPHQLRLHHLQHHLQHLNLSLVTNAAIAAMVRMSAIVEFAAASVCAHFHVPRVLDGWLATRALWYEVVFRLDALLVFGHSASDHFSKTFPF